MGPGGIAAEKADSLRGQRRGELRILASRRSRRQIGQAGVLAGDQDPRFQRDPHPVRPAAIAGDVRLDHGAGGHVEVAVLVGVIDPAELIAPGQKRA